MSHVPLRAGRPTPLSASQVLLAVGTEAERMAAEGVFEGAGRGQGALLALDAWRAAAEQALAEASARPGQQGASAGAKVADGCCKRAAGLLSRMLQIPAGSNAAAGEEGPLPPPGTMGLPQEVAQDLRLAAVDMCEGARSGLGLLEVVWAALGCGPPTAEEANEVAGAAMDLACALGFSDGAVEVSSAGVDFVCGCLARLHWLLWQGKAVARIDYAREARPTVR